MPRQREAQGFDPVGSYPVKKFPECKHVYVFAYSCSQGPRKKSFHRASILRNSAAFHPAGSFYSESLTVVRLLSAEGDFHTSSLGNSYFSARRVTRLTGNAHQAFGREA